MDLSKAFDKIKHDLPIAKLYAYGFNKESLKHLRSYLSFRWHRTKINNLFHGKILFKVCPHGFVHGPLLFNIYRNNLFCLAERLTYVNSENDTTFYAFDKDLISLINRLIC